MKGGQFLRRKCSDNLNANTFTQSSVNYARSKKSNVNACISLIQRRIVLRLLNKSILVRKHKQEREHRQELLHATQGFVSLKGWVGSSSDKKCKLVNKKKCEDEIRQ